MKNILSFIKTTSMKIKLAVIWISLMSLFGISMIGLLFVNVPELLLFFLIGGSVFGILGLTFYCLEIVNETWTTHKSEIRRKEWEAKFLK